MSADATPPQLGLFGAIEQPVIASWGAGLDSTAMIAVMLEEGERIDAITFADTGAERQHTYDFIPVFKQWVEGKHSVPVHVVRYQAKRFNNHPSYRTIDEQILVNGTLPSIAFGGGSCSQKWKAAPMEAWDKAFGPAQAAWAAGGKVIRLIGYDASPADNRRFKARNGQHENEKYLYRYPLRERGWTREDSANYLRSLGLQVPEKSSCYLCTACKPLEIRSLPRKQLRRIVLVEARAQPRLKTCEGLWRSTVKGMRGATPRPGSMTTFIREESLLPESEIAEIQQTATTMMSAFLGEDGRIDPVHRPAIGAWLELFDRGDQEQYRLADAGAAFKTAA